MRVGESIGSQTLRTIYPALEVAVEHIRELHSRQLHKLSDLRPWLVNYETALAQIRQTEATYYHPMEKRYD